MVKVSACEVNKKVFEHVMQYDFRNIQPWTLSLGLCNLTDKVKQERVGSH